MLPGVSEVSGGDVGMTIVMSADASRDDVLAAAKQSHTLATETAFLSSISLTRTGGGLDAELDAPSAFPWTIEVFPGEIEPTLDTLAGMLDVEQVPGASGLAVVSGWPYVTITNIDDFSAVFDAVSTTALFADGGTYSTDSDRLQIVHVPNRTSAEGVHAVIDIAVDYPQAEVLLQATTAGPQWPQLYVARLSVEEAAAIDTRLRSPELADTDPDGLPQRFQLSVIGPDGPTYTLGTFGNVPG